MRKVFVVFAFFAIALSFSIGVSAQSKSAPRRKHATSTARNAIVARELDRQRLFLQNVTSRYEAVSVNEFTPYLSYAYVWKALKENRDQLSRQRRGLTSAQFAAVKKGYEMLEQDVLLEFVDQQLSVLSNELDLNGIQTDDVEKLLTQDLKQKRSLLSAPGIDVFVFSQRVTALSDTTEKRILEILFPEQREKFIRQLRFSRDRLVG